MSFFFPCASKHASLIHDTTQIFDVAVWAHNMHLTFLTPGIPNRRIFLTARIPPWLSSDRCPIPLPDWFWFTPDQRTGDESGLCIRRREYLAVHTFQIFWDRVDAHISIRPGFLALSQKWSESLALQVCRISPSHAQGLISDPERSALGGLLLPPPYPLPSLSPATPLQSSPSCPAR
jgi:hypothetical protein